MKFMAVCALFISLLAGREVYAASDAPPTIPWFEIHVRSLDRSFPFYAQLFDWQCIPGRPPFKSCNVVRGGQEIGEVIENASAGTGNAVLIYFPVDSVTSVYQKALSLGASTVFPPMNIPDGHQGSIAVIKDLDGISIGIYSSQALTATGN